MVNAKHLATFILGAVAGVALHKYLQTEEGEKAFEDLKAKATDLKTEAEGALDKMPEYFEQLKNQGSEAMKKYTPEAEKMLQDLLSNLQGKGPQASAEGTQPNVEESFH